MSLNINNVIVSGRLARDSEVRATNNGSHVVSFAIAVTFSIRKNQNGEWEEESAWINVNAWYGEKAQPKQYYKGDEVICIGRLQENRYQKDGKDVSQIRLVADSVKLVTPSKNRPQEGQQPQQGYYGQAPQPYPPQGYGYPPPQGYQPTPYKQPQGYPPPSGYNLPPSNYQQPPQGYGQPPQQAPQPSPVYEYAKQQQAQAQPPKADATDVPHEQNIPKDIQEQQDTPF